MSVFKSHNYSLTKFSSFLNPKQNTNIKIKGDLNNLKENIFINDIKYYHKFKPFDNKIIEKELNILNGNIIKEKNPFNDEVFANDKTNKQNKQIEEENSFNDEEEINYKYNKKNEQIEEENSSIIYKQKF